MDICVCMCEYIKTCQRCIMYVYVCIYVCVCDQIHVSTNMYACVYVCVYVCISWGAARNYVRMVYICADGIYIYIYIYIYIWTYLHDVCVLIALVYTHTCT